VENHGVTVVMQTRGFDDDLMMKIPWIAMNLYELPWPSGLMLKLTGDWCHVYFHAKKSQLSS
jgi:hypothetical protein